MHADGLRASAIEQAKDARWLAAEGAPPRRARRSTRPAQRVPALLHGRVHIGAQADAALPRRRRRLGGVGRHRQLLRSSTGGSRMRMQCDHGCESEMQHCGAANGDYPASPAAASSCASLRSMRESLYSRCRRHCVPINSFLQTAVEPSRDGFAAETADVQVASQYRTYQHVSRAVE